MKAVDFEAMNEDELRGARVVLEHLWDFLNEDDIDDTVFKNKYLAAYCRVSARVAGMNNAAAQVTAATELASPPPPPSKP